MVVDVVVLPLDVNFNPTNRHVKPKLSEVSQNTRSAIYMYMYIYIYIHIYIHIYIYIYIYIYI